MPLAASDPAAGRAALRQSVAGRDGSRRAWRMSRERRSRTAGRRADPTVGSPSPPSRRRCVEVWTTTPWVQADSTRRSAEAPADAGPSSTPPGAGRHACRSFRRANVASGGRPARDHRRTTQHCSPSPTALTDAVADRRAARCRHHVACDSGSRGDLHRSRDGQALVATGPGRCTRPRVGDSVQQQGYLPADCQQRADRNQCWSASTSRPRFPTGCRSRDVPPQRVDAGRERHGRGHGRGHGERQGSGDRATHRDRRVAARAGAADDRQRDRLRRDRLVWSSAARRCCSSGAAVLRVIRPAGGRPGHRTGADTPAKPEPLRETAR